MDNIDVDFVTNPYLPEYEGFGMWYACIINAMLYAELSNKRFVYTPFHQMAHNYDNDPDFLAKKEKLINLIDHFPINRDLDFQKKWFVRCSMEHLPLSETLKTVKSLFFSGKSKEKYFQNDFVNVAIHIRKSNAHDNRQLAMPDDPAFYGKLIDALKIRFQSYPTRYHIYSQGNPEEFKLFESESVFLHINETIEDTFSAMALADVLVTAPSCFSCTAAFLSNGLIFYFPEFTINYMRLLAPGGQVIDLEVAGRSPMPHWQAIYC